MVLSIVTSSFAFAEPSQDKAQQDSAAIMTKLGLMKGYSNGDLGLTKKINRAEFATIIIRMTGYESKPFSPAKEIKFKDLSKTHWAYSTVRMAASLGYIKGYSDKSFKPSSNITYAEAIAIMVRALGYSGEVKGKWPDNYLNKAEGLGITKNLNIVANKSITRGDIAVLVVNSLPVTIK
jgi:hypothetical protein